MIFDLRNQPEPFFPDPLDLVGMGILDMEWEDDWLYAIGGSLAPEWLEAAYRLGIFPWFSFRNSDVPYWYCPMERFVIIPEEIHISHSMRNMMNRGLYEVTFNKAFDSVIENCSRLRIEMEGAWLGPEMIEAYKTLHRRGEAMSVEVWEGDYLVGGLYGVISGKIFCGESMFSLRSGASKLALISLARKLSSDSPGSCLIDCQLETPHLRSMGGRFISYEDCRSHNRDKG